MKIIICGAGQVGWQIARHLSGERNDVTVIDNNADLIRRALATGPALGRHEARWADAALAVHCGADRRRDAVEQAIQAAVRGSALAYIPALEALRAESG